MRCRWHKRNSSVNRGWSEVTKKCHKPGSPAQTKPELEGLRASTAHGVNLNRFSSDFKGQATSAIGIIPPAQMLMNRFSDLKPEKKLFLLSYLNFISLKLFFLNVPLKFNLLALVLVIHLINRTKYVHSAHVS